MRLDLVDGQAHRVPLMRPACQDGVIASWGMLYWGPWMCDCNHSLVGMIGVAPAGDFDFTQTAKATKRLQRADNFQQVEPLDSDDADWPGYRKSITREASSPAVLSERVRRRWEFDPATGVEPTAPVAAGDLVFWSGRDGIVYAVRASSGELAWTARTGGAVRFPPEVWNGRVYVGSCDGCVYCLEAKTGRQLWRFDAAPVQRKIAVHGSLMSNWPVGGGVLVSDGVVYAAAGLTSYDGTHVYALNAITGEIRWQNNSSSRLAGKDQVTGVSVQGHLLLYDGKLYLAGGNVVSPAIYDIADGRCLNALENAWWKRPKDATEQFPSRPEKSMFQRSPRGRELFLVDGEVQVFDDLLYSPPEYGRSRYFGGRFLQASSPDAVIRATTDRIVRLAGESSADGKPLGVWQVDSFREAAALALCGNAVLVIGELARDSLPQQDRVSEDNEPRRQYAAAMLRLDDGRQLWSEPLPAAPVSWGLAVTRSGTVIIALRDGRVIAVSGN
ncbi:MAG: PQQ-binding-like beta-propeller repeat protein [Pirellulaceae bacterium]